MSLKMFLAEAIADFSTVAAVTPSSEQLVEAMIEPLPLAKARVVVELGPGTGAMTRALLNALPRDATLFVFEVHDRVVEYLKSSICDSRLVLINASADCLDTELQRRGVDGIDAVVSSLGFGLMTEQQRRAILDGLRPLLRSDGVFTQFQYIHGLQFQQGRFRRLNLRPLLRAYFGSVQSKIVWRNLPPAFVFSCRPAQS